MSSRIEISKRLVLVNSASAVAARLINAAVLVWLHRFLIQRVSNAEYALYVVLMGLIVLLPLMTSVLTAGLGRYVLAAYAKGDDRGVTQIVSTMFPLLVAAGLLVLAAGLAFAWHIDKILTVAPGQVQDARLMMALLILSIATRPPCAAFSVGLYVLQKFVLQNFLRVCDEMLRLLLLFILLFGVSARVLWVVVANVTAEIAMTAVIVLISVRLIPALKFRVREIRWGLVRELVSFGVWNFVASAAYRLRQAALPLILNKLAMPVDLVVFNVGFLPRRIIEQWAEVVGAPLYPVVTGMYAMGAKARVQAVYLRGGRIALWSALLVALPAAIYARTLVGLYIGNQYMEAAVVMALMLACLPITEGTWMVWKVANATGRVRPAGIRAFVSQMGIIAVALYLVSRLGWGATGVALATFTVGAVTSIVLIWPLGLKLAEVSFGAWVEHTLVPGLTPGCVAGVVWVALGLVVRPDSWLGLGLCTAAGILCYMTVLLALCLEPRDRQDLLEVLARVRYLAGDRLAALRAGPHTGPTEVKPPGAAADVPGEAPAEPSDPC